MFQMNYNFANFVINNYFITIFRFNCIIMLIRFVVENFKSFKEETEFNLLTGNIRKHPSHVHHTKQGIDILPTSVIYGGNASGKSNLVKAIKVAREIIIVGTVSKESSFQIEKYALESSYFNKPSKFEFEFKTAKNTYAYGFVIDYDRVIEEWLYLISGKKEDKPLFIRNNKNFEFKPLLTKKKTELEFLQNEVRGIRKNQLFLTESYRREIGFFDDVLDWFQSLMIIFPQNIIFNRHTFYNKELLDFTNQLLDIGDTNVSIDVRAVDAEKLVSANPKLREYIKNNFTLVKRNGIAFESEGGIIYSIRFKSNENNTLELEAIKLMGIHQKSDSNFITFETHQESDGTQRLIDLSAPLYLAIFKNRVVIIDEIDRSLHPLLSKKIIENFIEKRITNKGTGQLICTTHEDLLIDMDVLRPDEVWFVQKNDDGASELYPLSEFKIRYDIDVRKGYLNGRFGAIPNINEKAKIA